ncbi:MAG: ribonuclease P protein subunit [archaeon]
MIKTDHYTITRERLPIHELIGLDMSVTENTDSHKKGLSGVIVDETQRMFIIDTPAGEKKIPKRESTFAFMLGSETVSIEGKDLLSNPIERLKNGGKILYA